jgi:hypothetical protein
MLLVRTLTVLAGFALAVASSLTPVAVHASPITLSYSSTTQSVCCAANNYSPFVLGEAFTIELVVDNGGTSTINQTWDETDFVSISASTAGGYTYSSTAITASTSSFQTGASGNVIAVGNWEGSSGFSVAVTTSEFGATTGGWFINGFNDVLYSNGSSTALSEVSTNGGEPNGNQNPASWSAAAVPEPGTFVLLGLGLAGIGFTRQSRRLAQAPTARGM